MSIENEINIILSTNDKNFYQALFVVHSIIKNRNISRQYNIFLFNLNLSQAFEKQFYNLSNINVTLQIIKIDDDRFSGIKLKTYPTEAILRLITAILLPTKKKALYLDTDIFVKSGIEDLFDIDIKEAHAAIVHDGLIDYKGTASPYRTAIGMKNTHLYFNSGVMLINIELWKKDEIFEKSISWFEQYGNIGSFADQDALNVVLEDKIMYIPPRWNLQITLINSILYKGRVAKSFEAELINAKIVHFAGERKPWNYFGYIPFARQYIIEFNKFCDLYDVEKIRVSFLRYYLEYINHYLKCFRSKLRANFRHENQIINIFDKSCKN